MNKIFLIITILLIFLFNQVIRLNANDDTYINSSNITYNEKENIIELSENSKINFKNTNILIDKGIIDYNKNEFEVFGNFYLYEELTILSGENLKGNTSLNTFTANNVSYIYNDDLKVDSDNLDRKNNIINFYNNFLTPCELDGFFNCPTWSLRIDKTEYDIKEDKFTHFDTFLQIADYKVFYLPYFTHYGAKAPRKKGFLTPTIEFTVGGDQGIIAPYYLPIAKNTEVLIKPKIFLSPSFEFLEKYQLSTTVNNKSSGGETSIFIDNIKNQNNDNINTSFKINTKQVVNKNMIISASGLFTNSISTTRSINEEPIAFEDIYLRSENYDLLVKDDYLKMELSSVESFDTVELNSIPISPSLTYTNLINIKNYPLINELNFTILKRNESSANSPSESFKLNISNELSERYFLKNLFFKNKIIINNSYNDYYFNKNESLNHDSFKSNIKLSSDLYYQKISSFTPRLKLISPIQLENSNKNINEESNSITFNYQNQFSESRFFGNDLFDSSPRIVYGLENFIKLKEQKIFFNVNQSYEINLNSRYSNLINQTTRFSDYSIETGINKDNILFVMDTRLDEKTLSKKEINYSLIFEDPLKINLSYNETQKEAFKDLSNDTQSLKLGVSKKINENFELSYSSNLDVKNNYDPYESTLRIILADECSQLDINYTNTRFNDDYNTKPQETIGMSFSMDYLGFFGYEQTTDLFFKEPGNINYGL